MTPENVVRKRIACQLRQQNETGCLRKVIVSPRAEAGPRNTVVPELECIKERSEPWRSSFAAVQSCKVERSFWQECGLRHDRNNRFVGQKRIELERYVSVRRDFDDTALVLA